MEGKVREMNKNLKRVIATAMVAGFAVFGVACSSNQEPAQPEYVTYEFETYDGTKVVIDETNIITQQEDKDVLESKLVPADAEVIAPGRDYVYLEDDTCYYVEDTTKNLVTIAAKGDAVVNGNPNVVAFGGEGYSLTYNPDAITLTPDEETRSVTLSYTKDGVEMAGSNVMTFTVVDDATAEGVIQEQAASFGEDADVTEVPLNDNVTAFEVTFQGESEGSDLKTVQTYYGIQQGNNVILIDTFRTVDPNEDVQAGIDQEFDNVFQSLALD